MLVSASAMADAPNHLCKTGERVIFGCSLPNKKLVSLCASGDFGAASGYLQYRYRTAKKIELAFPSDLAAPKGKFYFSRAMFSGGGASRIRFVIDGNEYFVFESTIRTNFKPGEPNDPEFSSGVFTRRNGKVTSTHRCKDEVSVNDDVSTLLDNEPFDYDVNP
jgi:hypothetical protein